MRVFDFNLLARLVYSASFSFPERRFYHYRQQFLMPCMTSDSHIMEFRPPSAEKMDLIAIHSREPKFQLRFPSLFLQFTMPMPAFEPFLRSPRGGCHTLNFQILMRVLLPSFACAKFTPFTRIKSVARTQVPATEPKPAPAAHNAQASTRAKPQVAESEALS